MTLLQAEIRIISARVHYRVHEEINSDEGLSQKYRLVGQVFGGIITLDS
jgi:hypothetical protein